ncbi:MAG: thioredoxin-disulfide reductase [Candidatus Omnitrophica bacterium]|nr:thioredoxin-disulfide reductase [Candidatus Omnitrophota bacterium]
MIMDDLIIIGAGPAGLTAAIYAARFKLKVRIFEKFSWGGQILLSPSIENYPGFPEGISTAELMDRFKKQVDSLGLPIENRNVINIEANSQGYGVKAESELFNTKTVIIASGAASKRLGVEGEEKFIGRGVSYCGTCDGPLFKGKDIAVIGGGDRAIEDAIFLSSYAKTLYLIHRRSEFRASGILVEKARRIKNIQFVLDSVAEEVCGSNRVESVSVRNLKNQTVSQILCQGVFIFVGITPNTEFVKGLLDRDESGFIITNQQMGTSKEGVFACGDCVKKSLYQVISACGEGAVAADSAHKYILNQ